MFGIKITFVRIFKQSSELQALKHAILLDVSLLLKPVEDWNRN